MPNALNKYDNTATYIAFTTNDVAYIVPSSDGEYIFDYDRDGNLVGAEILFDSNDLMDIDIPKLEQLGSKLSKGKFNSQSMGSPPEGAPPPDLGGGTSRN